MTPEQRKAVQEASAILQQAGLFTIPAMLQAMHMYCDAFGDSNSTHAQQVRAADALGPILDEFRVRADIVLSDRTPVRHLPASNGSTIAFLRHGRAMTPAEHVVYRMHLDREGKQGSPASPQVA